MIYFSVHDWQKNALAQSRLLLSQIELGLEKEATQLPLYIPICVGMGIAAWFTLGSENWPYIIFPALILIAVGLSAKLKFRLNLVTLMVGLSVIIGWSAISIRSYSIAAPILEKPWIGHIYGRIDRIEKLPARSIVRLILETEGQQSLPEKIRINLSNAQYDDAFTIGSILKAKVRLLPPAGPAVPGAYDFAQRAWFDSLGATGSALGEVTMVNAAQSNVTISNIRDQIATQVRAKIKGRAGAIGATLASGDRGAIAMEDAEAMRRSGMAHLLAISGLHVTAVVMMSFFIIAKILSLFPSFALRHRVPIFAASIAALIAIFYTILTGMQVPTIRACIAACLVLAALIMGRDPLTLRLVAFGALFILLIMPEVLVGPSFQLSFAAVATIITLHETTFMQKLVHRREEIWLKALGRFLLSLFITGLFIEIALAPIALYHFQKTGIYGALANMLAIPLTTFIIIPSGIAAFVFDMVGLGTFFWWICGQSIEIILTLAHYVSNLPAAITTVATIDITHYAIIIISGLAIMIVKSNYKLLALGPLAIAFFFLLRTPSPDIVITGDGQHLAVKKAGGRGKEDAMLLLRTRAGRYIRELLNENAGFDGEASDIANWPGAQCSPDICIIALEKEQGASKQSESEQRGSKQGGSKQRNNEQGPWTILATTSNHFVPRLELAAACKRVDIAISNRYLPYDCKPKRLKIDRAFHDKSGGVAIYLSSGRIRNVASENGHLPWSEYNENRPTTYPPQK